MDVEQRAELARELLSRGTQPPDLQLAPELALVPEQLVKTQQAIHFPADLRPVPQPMDPAPSPQAQLPRADVVVITWTVDEVDALADVLTPGFGRATWYRYAKDFAAKYQPFYPSGRTGPGGRTDGELHADSYRQSGCPVHEVGAPPQPGREAHGR